MKEKMLYVLLKVQASMANDFRHTQFRYFLCECKHCCVLRDLILTVFMGIVHPRAQSKLPISASSASHVVPVHPMDSPWNELCSGNVLVC